MPSQQRDRVRHISVRRRQCKLTENDIPLIRTLIDCGIPQWQIAIYYNVTKGVISNIKCGRTWRHVPYDLYGYCQMYFGYQPNDSHQLSLNINADVNTNVHANSNSNVNVNNNVNVNVNMNANSNSNVNGNSNCNVFVSG